MVTAVKNILKKENKDMVVSIVLDTEYMGVAERKKWFLKNVSEALDTNMLIITKYYNISRHPFRYIINIIS